MEPIAELMSAIIAAIVVATIGWIYAYLLRSSRRRTSLTVMAGIAVLILLVATGSLVVLPSLLPASTPTPTATPVQTVATPPTYTPYPTYTPVPTATHTPIPTATHLPIPTAAPSRTPTPTPTLLPPPRLIQPRDGSAINPGDILRWEPVKELGPDEYYVLSIKFRHEEAGWSENLSLKETTWTVPNYFGPPHSSSGMYFWSVAIMRRVGIDPSGIPIGEPISKPSEIWSFYVPKPATSTP